MVTKRIKPMASGGGNSHSQTPTSAIINSIASTTTSNTKKCPRISSEAKTILQTWCSNHPHDGIIGYPTPEETVELIQRTGLEKDQLDQWFFRRRKKQRLIMPKTYGHCIDPSKYRGIQYSKRIEKYVVQVFHKSCYEFVGEFDLASDAAWANDCKVKELKGEFWTLNFRNREEFECAKHLELQSRYEHCGGDGRLDGRGSVMAWPHSVNATDRKRGVNSFLKHSPTLNRVSLCLEGEHHDILTAGNKSKVKLETYDVHHRARSMSPSIGQKRTIENVHADSNSMHQQRESGTSSSRSALAHRIMTDKIPRKRTNICHAEALMQLATPVPNQQISMDVKQISERERNENESEIEEGEIVEVEEEYAASYQNDNQSYETDNFVGTAEDSADLIDVKGDDNGVDCVVDKEDDYFECREDVERDEAHRSSTPILDGNTRFDDANHLELGEAKSNNDEQNKTNESTSFKCEDETAEEWSTCSDGDDAPVSKTFDETNKQAFDDNNDGYMEGETSDETYAPEEVMEKTIAYYQGICKQLSAHLTREHRRKTENVKLRQEVAALKEENSELKKQVVMIEKVMSARNAVMDIFSD